MTRSTDDFINKVPQGAHYVLSNEGHGFGFSGEIADQAKKLTEANFRRVRARRAARASGSAPSPGRESVGP